MKSPIHKPRVLNKLLSMDFQSIPKLPKPKSLLKIESARKLSTGVMWLSPMKVAKNSSQIQPCSITARNHTRNTSLTTLKKFEQSTISRSNLHPVEENQVKSKPQNSLRQSHQKSSHYQLLGTSEYRGKPFTEQNNTPQLCFKGKDRSIMNFDEWLKTQSIKSAIKSDHEREMQKSLQSLEKQEQQQVTRSNNIRLKQRNSLHTLKTQLNLPGPRFKQVQVSHAFNEGQALFKEVVPVSQKSQMITNIIDSVYYRKIMDPQFDKV